MAEKENTPSLPETQMDQDDRESLEENNTDTTELDWYGKYDSGIEDVSNLEEDIFEIDLEDEVNQTGVEEKDNTETTEESLVQLVKNEL